MFERNIHDGSWVEAETQEQFDALLEGVRVKKGEWDGPGQYYLLRYMQRCPRGCCWDDVVELLSADETQVEVRDRMSALAEILRRARTV